MKEKIQAFMAKRQAKGKRSYEIDMCNGPLLGKILLFSLPLMLSGMLQLLFNAADIIVVGRFVGDSALAAVGSAEDVVVEGSAGNIQRFTELVDTIRVVWLLVEAFQEDQLFLQGHI